MNYSQLFERKCARLHWLLWVTFKPGTLIIHDLKRKIFALRIDNVLVAEFKLEKEGGFCFGLTKGSSTQGFFETGLKLACMTHVFPFVVSLHGKIREPTNRKYVCKAGEVEANELQIKVV